MAERRGLTLDENLDMVVSSTGDIAFDEGLTEVEKNLSYLLHRILFPIPGAPANTELLKEIEHTVEEVIGSYEPVESVVGTDVYLLESESTIKVDVYVFTADGRIMIEDTLN